MKMPNGTLPSHFPTHQKHNQAMPMVRHILDLLLIKNRRKTVLCLVVVFLYLFASYSACFYKGFAQDDEKLKLVQPQPQFYLEEVLASQRVLIQEDMQGYNYSAIQGYGDGAPSLADLVSERGGRPISIVILSSWRSGSTFLGAILQNHPAVYYHYEPLRLMLTQVRDDLVAKYAVRDIRALLQCKYNEINHFRKIPNSPDHFHDQNTRLWNQCRKHGELCSDARKLSKFCKLFPIQMTKVVRLRLRYAERLLTDTRLNVKVIYLVRDPRPTMRSRKKEFLWCLGDVNCEGPEVLCYDQEEDHKAAVELSSRFPDTFRVIRYEDLSVNAHSYSKNIFDFLGLEFHEKVREYLITHTSRTNVFQSTTRDSKTTPFVWQQEMDHQEVAEIQGVCEGAMQRWGYQLARNFTHQRTFKPVGSFGKDLKSFGIVNDRNATEGAG